MNLAKWRPLCFLLLGAAGCAVCCAVPLAAVALGAGVATSALVVLQPIGAALVVGGVALALITYLRARRRTSFASCAIDRSCCGPSLDERAAALGCTLPPDELPARGEQFRRLFARGLVRRERHGNRAIWTFAWSPELERDARALAVAEQGCCSFWQFDLERRGDQLRWETAVPDDRAEAIALLDGIAAAAMPSSSHA